MGRWHDYGDRVEEFRLLCKTRAYELWHNLRSRARKKLAAGRTDGGRFCARFDTDFLALMDHLKADPGRKFSIGRVDPLGQWSCGACDDCKAHGLAANVAWLPKSQNRGVATRRRQTRALRDADRLGAAPDALDRLATLERQVAELREALSRLESRLVT